MAQSLHRRSAALWQVGPPHDYPQYFPLWLKNKADHLEREWTQRIKNPERGNKIKDIT
jgi:hypothetical protein